MTLAFVKSDALPSDSIKQFACLRNSVNKITRELRGTFVVWPVFDLETTGFDPYNDKIIEIGAVKLDGTKIIDRFSTFVNPQKSIPPKITEITSINDSMVKDAPIIENVIIDFMKFCGNATLVAHNAGFDVGFIKQNLAHIGRNFENSVIDTLHWSRNILKENKRHNLKELCKYFSISLEN